MPPLTAASELRTIKRARESEAGASTVARATRVVVRTGRSPPLVALAAIFALVHTAAAWVFPQLGCFAAWVAVSQLGWFRDPVRHLHNETEDVGGAVGGGVGALELFGALSGTAERCCILSLNVCITRTLLRDRLSLP